MSKFNNESDKNLYCAIKARCPIIWVRSYDEIQIINSITNFLGAEYIISVWDCLRGLYVTGENEPGETEPTYSDQVETQALNTMKTIYQQAFATHKSNTLLKVPIPFVWILPDFDEHLSPQIMRYLKEYSDLVAISTIIIISHKLPPVDLPVVRIDFPFPSSDDYNTEIKKICEQVPAAAEWNQAREDIATNRQEIIDILQSHQLCKISASSLVAMTLVKYKTVTPEYLKELVRLVV